MKADAFATTRPLNSQPLPRPGSGFFMVGFLGGPHPGSDINRDPSHGKELA